MPNNVKHAQTAKIFDEARQLALEDWDEITDPFSAMARSAGKAERLEEILLEKVEQLDTLRSSAGQYGEQIDVVFAAYERAVQRLHAILTSMARLDLIDKIAALQSRVDEQTAELVTSAMMAALNEAPIEADVRDLIARAFGEYLRSPRMALASGM